MASARGNPARLFIALAVACALAVFLVYTALSGTTPALQPSNLVGHPGTVSLTGKVVKIETPLNDSHTTYGLRFKIHNIDGKSPVVPIIYHGSVPDLFATGRDVNMTGELVGGTFVATALTTKCPSKYTASA